MPDYTYNTTTNRLAVIDWSNYAYSTNRRNRWGGKINSWIVEKLDDNLYLIPTMVKIGDCYDNAMCESFFATLECELIERTRFDNHAQAKREVFRFIEGWYNPHRRYSALDYLSPINYEQWSQTDTAA
jgi:transposase InsO family protein